MLELAPYSKPFFKKGVVLKLNPYMLLHIMLKKYCVMSKHDLNM